MLISILLIICSIEAVTARGIAEGGATIFQMISPTGRYYDLAVNCNLPFEPIKNILFAFAILLLFVPNFLLFEKSKARSATLMFVNIIGISVGFLFYNSYSHILMMITLCFLITANILIQFTDSIKNRTNMLVITLTVFIFVSNCYFLLLHLSKESLCSRWGVGDNLVSEMTDISKINFALFALWLIPYVILLIREIKTIHKGRTQNEN